MKKCASPCLPSHATEPQLTRFELLLTRMEQAGYDPRTADYQQQLKDFFHRSENMNNLDGALASFEVTVRQMEDISAAVRIATTGEGVELPRTPEEWTAMRNSVQQAQATLNNPGASPDQIRGALEAIARLAVAQARAYLATTAAPANAATPFTGEALAGMCGVGRDISADVVSQATIGQRTPVVIERMQAAQMGIPGVDARHAFTVVTLPDGSRFLIDPTFAQFATPARRGMTAQGMQGTPEGAALSRELLTNGFIRLTGDTATQYALGLGASPELAQAYGAAIMFGHGSVLTEFVQNGRVVRVSARPGEADNTLLAPLTADQDGVGGSTVDLRRALQNLPANAPLRPILEDLLARLRGLLAVQTPVAQLPGAQPPPAAP